MEEQKFYPTNENVLKKKDVLYGCWKQVVMEGFVYNGSSVRPMETILNKMGTDIFTVFHMTYYDGIKVQQVDFYGEEVDVLLTNNANILSNLTMFVNQINNVNYRFSHIDVWKQIKMALDNLPLEDVQKFPEVIFNIIFDSICALSQDMRKVVIESCIEKIYDWFHQHGVSQLEAEDKGS